MSIGFIKGYVYYAVIVVILICNLTCSISSCCVILICFPNDGILRTDSCNIVYKKCLAMNCNLTIISQRHDLLRVPNPITFEHVYAKSKGTHHFDRNENMLNQSSSIHVVQPHL